MFLRRAFQGFLRRPTPRQVFSSFTDAQWKDTLVASVDQRVQHGIKLPGFPDPDLQRRTIGSANKGALQGAFAFYSFVRSTCVSLGAPIGARTTILDFGVCWGRIIRCFLRETDPDYLHGVHIDSEFLAAAEHTGCPGTLSKIEPLGKLPYPDGMFGLVYAYSVFTHLPEHVQDHWLAEIVRVMRPGGLFFATVQPPRFLDKVRLVNSEDPTSHPWLTTLKAYLDDNPELPSLLESQGSIFMSTGADTYGDRIMTEKYVRSHRAAARDLSNSWTDPRYSQAVVAAER